MPPILSTDRLQRCAQRYKSGCSYQSFLGLINEKTIPLRREGWFFSKSLKLVNARLCWPSSLYFWQQWRHPQFSSFPWPASDDLGELATFLKQSSSANRPFRR